MTTLASKDTSGILTPQEGETEVLRTRSAKRFHVAGNQYRVGSTIGPLHYKADPFDTEAAWEEIDLDINLTPGEAWDAAMEANGYQVHFWQNLVRGSSTFRYGAQFIRAGRWIGMAPLAVVYENAAGARQLVSWVQSGITPVIDNDANHVTWPNAFGTGLHFRYNVSPDKFFKCLIVDSLASLPTPTIGATGRKLSLVMAVEWDFGTTPGVAFAEGVETGLGSNTTGTPDETLADPDAYPHTDERGEVWWLQRPMAWDSPDANGETRSVPVAWRLERLGSQVLAVFSVAGTALQHASTVYPVFIDTAITEEAVGSQSDNYNVRESVPGTVTIPGMTGNMLFGRFSSTSNIFVTRFTSVPIPNAATVDSASVTYKARAADTSSLTVSMQVELADDSVSASDGSSFSTPAWEAKTWSSGTNWTPGSWTLNNSFASGDFAGDVQSVADRPGWAEGAISVRAVGPYAGSDAFRRPYTYESGAANAPKFNATYTEGGGDPEYGEIVGSCSIGLSTSGSLTGYGAVSGDASLALTTSGALTGTGAVSGSSNVALTTAGSLTGYGAVAGSSDITLTTTGALTGWGDLAGSSNIALTASASFGVFGAVSGSSSLSLNTSGILTGWGAVAGSSNVALTTSGALVGYGAVSGGSTLSLDASGSLTGYGSVAGSSSIAVNTGGVLVGWGDVSGSSLIAFTVSAALADAEEVVLGELFATVTINPALAFGSITVAPSLAFTAITVRPSIQVGGIDV